MMTILLNNQTLSLAAPCSLEKLLDAYGYNAGHFAIAVNKNFLPKSRYADTLLQEGDQVEILTPMQGG